MTALLVITIYLMCNSCLQASANYSQKNQSELIHWNFWRRLKAPLAGTVADVERRSIR